MVKWQTGYIKNLTYIQKHHFLKMGKIFKLHSYPKNKRMS